MTRVHSTTESENGSPDATPCRNDARNSDEARCAQQATSNAAAVLMMWISPGKPIIPVYIPVGITLHTGTLYHHQDVSPRLDQIPNGYPASRRNPMHTRRGRAWWQLICEYAALLQHERQAHEQQASGHGLVEMRPLQAG